MSSFKNQGFCLFKNFSCDTYRCCGFCNNEKCEWRCKDDPTKCKLFSGSDPQLEVESRSISKEPALCVKSKTKVKEVQVQITQSTAQEDIQAKLDRKKEARRLRRLKRKEKNKTV